jgi:hypothetical protein
MKNLEHYQNANALQILGGNNDDTSDTESYVNGSRLYPTPRTTT